MDYLSIIFIGFLVSVATGVVLDVKRAIKLPGGSIAVGISFYLYQDLNLVLSVLCGLAGHLLYLGVIWLWKYYD